MAAASYTEIQGIRTSMLALYPRSAGAPSQRSHHRARFQHYHSIPTNQETLLLLYTTTTLSCPVPPRPKVLRNRMANPRASETHHHHRNRPQEHQRRQKLGRSKLNWPRHEPALQQLLRWRRNVSRLDLAGALIDFVRVSIPLYFSRWLLQ